MKHMNKLTSAFRHRDNKYWVPSEGLNDSSRGNCKNNNAAVGRQGDTT